MDDEYSIKNTTKEQREKIIRDSLSCCGDGCSEGDAYGTADPLEMYKPYIDGEKEISEINEEFRTKYVL